MANGKFEPQEEVCLIQESLSKWATLSLAEIYVDIIPGYRIREMTEVETDQKVFFPPVVFFRNFRVKYGRQWK